MKAARLSMVRMERLGKANGGTNSGLSGTPRVGWEAHRYWLVAMLNCLSFNAKTPLTLASALVSHSQFRANRRSSFTYLSGIKSNSPAFISGTIINFSSLVSVISAAAW